MRNNIDIYQKQFNKNALSIVRYLKGGISVSDIYNLTLLEYQLYLSNVNEMVETEQKAINNNNK